jgi:hypothetical protein
MRRSPRLTPTRLPARLLPPAALAQVAGGDGHGSRDTHNGTEWEDPVSDNRDDTSPDIHHERGL